MSAKKFMLVPGTSNVYATATGLKATHRGKVLPAGVFFGVLPSRGDARRVRKALRRMGRSDLAASPRTADLG